MPPLTPGSATTPVSRTRSIVAYIRRSNDEGDPEAQVRDVRRVAASFGYDPDQLDIVNDWDWSGTSRERPGWLSIQQATLAGDVEAIFAVSTDRLGRDVEDYMRFERAAHAVGTRIITGNEGERRPDRTVIERYIHPLIAQQYSEDQQRRARRAKVTIAENVQRHHAEAHKDCPGTFRVFESQPHKPKSDGTWGDPVLRVEFVGPHTCRRCPAPRHWPSTRPYGTQPREDPAVVVAAFREAGGYHPAAKLLNARGVTARRGLWDSVTVKRVVRAEAMADAALLRQLPHRVHQGSRTLSVHALSGLVECHCGLRLTATWRTERAGRAVGLFCREARRNSEHSRPYSIKQGVVIEALRPAMRVLGFGLPELPSVAAVEARIDHEVADLDAQLAARRIDGRDYLVRRDALDAERAALSARGPELPVGATVQFIPPVAWGAAPDEVNAQLRRWIDRVVLDESFRPLGLVWRQDPLDGGERVPGGWFVLFRDIEALPEDEDSN